MGLGTPGVAAPQHEWDIRLWDRAEARLWKKGSFFLGLSSLHPVPPGRSPLLSWLGPHLCVSGPGQGCGTTAVRWQQHSVFRGKCPNFGSQRSKTQKFFYSQSVGSKAPMALFRATQQRSGIRIWGYIPTSVCTQATQLICIWLPFWDAGLVPSQPTPSMELH